MKFISFLFLITMFSFGATQAADAENRGVCDSIPSNCIVNGQINKECLCRVWCQAACGGAACNCDILPKSNNDAAQNKVVNEKACQERIDKILADKKKSS